MEDDNKFDSETARVPLPLTLSIPTCHSPIMVMVASRMLAPTLVLAGFGRCAWQQETSCFTSQFFALLLPCPMWISKGSWKKLSDVPRLLI